MVALDLNHPVKHHNSGYSLLHWFRAMGFLQSLLEDSLVYELSDSLCNLFNVQ